MNIHVPEGMQVPDFVPTFDTEDGFISITLKQNHRLALETTVERLINMLDDMDAGSEDLEPSHGWLNVGSQAHLHAQILDECEEENEHGGDIQDVPHDASDEGNDEPTLGRLETIQQTAASYTGVAEEDAVSAAVRFDGDGCLAGRAVLRNLRSARPDVPQNYVGGWCDGNHSALQVNRLTITGKKAKRRSATACEGV